MKSPSALGLTDIPFQQKLPLRKEARFPSQINNLLLSTQSTSSRVFRSTVCIISSILVMSSFLRALSLASFSSCSTTSTACSKSWWSGFSDAVLARIYYKQKTYMPVLAAADSAIYVALAPVKSQINRGCDSENFAKFPNCKCCLAVPVKTWTISGFEHVIPEATAMKYTDYHSIQCSFSLTTPTIRSNTYMFQKYIADC